MGKVADKLLDNKNLVLFVVVAAAAYYLVTKVKNAAVDAAGDVYDFVNPFQAGDAIPEFLGGVASSIKNTIDSAGVSVYEKALKDRGLNPNDWVLWSGGRGAVPPRGAIFVRSGRTGSYFVRKK